MPSRQKEGVNPNPVTYSKKKTLLFPSIYFTCTRRSVLRDNSTLVVASANNDTHHRETCTPVYTRQLCTTTSIIQRLLSLISHTPGRDGPTKRRQPWHPATHRRGGPTTQTTPAARWTCRCRATGNPSADCRSHRCTTGRPHRITIRGARGGGGGEGRGGCSLLVASNNGTYSRVGPIKKNATTFLLRWVEGKKSKVGC